MNLALRRRPLVVTYSLGSRMFIARAHRRGMRLSRSQQYAAAIQAYGESYDFFARHTWIDRFRAITMMSPSAISYCEMGLRNIAFSFRKLIPQIVCDLVRSDWLLCGFDTSRVIECQESSGRRTRALESACFHSSTPASERCRVIAATNRRHTAHRLGRRILCRVRLCRRAGLLVGQWGAMFGREAGIIPLLRIIDRREVSVGLCDWPRLLTFLGTAASIAWTLLFRSLPRSSAETAQP
jgi:hypothetical protein